MPRKKQVNKNKKPVEAATSTDLNNNVNDKSHDITTKNSTIKNGSLSMDMNEIALSETQMFQENGNYKPVYFKEDEPRCRNWSYIVYPESVPPDWIEQLQNTGLPFTISPLHDRDINPDGTLKKPHYHVIVSYSNTTTYSSISGLRTITKGPFPIACKNVSGMYAYFTHKHNPEKYQYNSNDIQKFNGWEKALEANEISALMEELTLFIFDADIMEYSDFMLEARLKGPDYFTVAMKHTIYFTALIRSYRCSPVTALTRYCKYLHDDDAKSLIVERINKYEKENRRRGRIYGRFES